MQINGPHWDSLHVENPCLAQRAFKTLKLTLYNNLVLKHDNYSSLLDDAEFEKEEISFQEYCKRHLSLTTLFNTFNLKGKNLDSKIKTDNSSKISEKNEHSSSSCLIKMEKPKMPKFTGFCIKTKW